MCSSLLWDEKGWRRRERESLSGGGVVQERRRRVASAPGLPARELSQRQKHIVIRDTAGKICGGRGEVNVDAGASADEPFEFGQPEGEVQVLDSLHRGTFEQVVLGGDHHGIEPV